MSTTPGTTTSLDGFHTTPTAQRADALIRSLFAAINADDNAELDRVLARSVLSYDVHGTRTRTGFKNHVASLRRSFPDLRFEVHENIGVLVEGDLVALRTIITGTHKGDYAGHPGTGTEIQTSASHIFRLLDDQVVEHWQVFDTYRILVAIGAIDKAANAFQQILGVEQSPGGLFPERLGSEFGRSLLPVSREESHAIVRQLYDGIITTGRPEDVEVVAESYVQNSGWTPDGRDAFASAIAVSRGAMPDGLALQTHIVAEKNRTASRSVWDGTIAGSGRAADFTTLDFFLIDDGLIVEHWETTDWVRAYQSFGLLPEDLRDI
jgi:predicted ester cyclase